MEEKRIRVKAEEYIKGLVTTNGCGEIDKDVDVIEETIALRAISIARQEERTKACKAYCLASGCDDANDCHATYCAEMETFKELLNK